MLVDGRDTGYTTPVGVLDHVVVGTGKHRISFVVGDRATDVDVYVSPYRYVCIYRTLGR